MKAQKKTKPTATKRPGKKKTKEVSNLAAVQIEDQPGPNIEMDTNILTAYGKARVEESDALESAAAVRLWYAGAAYKIIADRLKPTKGEWSEWLKGCGVSQGKVCKAIRLHEGCPKPQALEGMNICKAMAVYAPPPKPKEKPADDETEITQPEEGGDKVEQDGVVLVAVGWDEWARKAEEVGEDPVDLIRDTLEQGGNVVLAAESSPRRDDGDARAGWITVSAQAGVAVVEAAAFRQLSSLDERQEVLVVRDWTPEAKDARRRGVVVIVCGEIEEGCQP